MAQGMITTNLLAFLGFQLIFLFEKIKIHCRKSKLQTIGGSEQKEEKNAQKIVCLKWLM